MSEAVETETRYGTEPRWVAPKPTETSGRCPLPGQRRADCFPNSLQDRLAIVSGVNRNRGWPCRNKRDHVSVLNEIGANRPEQRSQVAGAFEVYVQVVQEDDPERAGLSCRRGRCWRASHWRRPSRRSTRPPRPPSATRRSSALQCHLRRRTVGGGRGGDTQPGHSKVTVTGDSQDRRNVEILRTRLCRICRRG